MSVIPPSPIALNGPPPYWQGPLPMWIFDNESLRFLDVNAIASEVYGWSRDQFLSMTVSDIGSDREAAQVDRLKATPQNTNKNTGPWVHRDAGGRERVVNITTCEVSFEGRAATLVTVWDRTAEYDAYAALSMRENDLREREAMLRLTMKAAGVGTFRRDLRAGTTEVSPEARALHGSLPEGNPLPIEAWLRDMVPEDRACVEQAIVEALAARAPGLTVEYRLRDPATGTVRHIEARAAYEYASDGTPNTAFGVIINVTDRKAAARALAESEQRYRSVVETAADGIVIADSLGRIVTANAATLRMFGYSSLADMVGRDLGMLMPPEHARSHVHYVAAHRSGAPPRVLGVQGRDLMAQRRDGSLFPIELSVGSFTVDGVLSLTGIVRDVTERRQADAALAERDVRLRLAHEAAGIGQWEVDLLKGVTRLSSEAARLYGLAPDHPLEFPRAHWRQLVHPDDVERAWWKHGDGSDPFATFDATFRIPQRDGSHRWIQALGRAIPGQDGAPVRIIGVNIDVTARRILEERLRDSEDRLRAIVEAVPLAIVKIGRDGAIDSANSAAAALLGDAPSLLDRVAAEDRTAWQAAHSRVCAGETLQWEVDLAGRYGERHRVEASGVPFPLAGGGNGQLAVLRDVTAMREAEARLRGLEAEAMRASRLGAMGAMAAGLAHELNQPLGAVMNYAGAAAMVASRAAMAEDERARLAALLEKASTQALRASGIVKRLRDFIGRADREVTALRVADLLEEVRAEALQRRKAEINISVVPPGLHIFGDTVQLRQVITNLLANALEAAPPRSRPHVTINACRSLSGEGVEIVVRDDGPGIPPDVRRRLFEPVVSRKPEGMGIGLAMCRAIVEAHGGRIWAAPEAPDCGAAFHVLVPDEERVLQGNLDDCDT